MNPYNASHMKEEELPDEPLRSAWPVRQLRARGNRHAGSGSAGPRPFPVHPDRTQAEAGRSAEVYFSEQAEAGDPRFVAKMAHTKLWVQTRPGEFRELQVRQAADRLRAAAADRSLAVVGECEYGVLARPNQTPFLLRYYPKAVAGRAEELNRLTPRKKSRSRSSRRSRRNGHQDKDKSTGGRIRLVALRHGKPVPSAVFTAVDSDLSEQTIKAGPDGTAGWTPPAPGRYSVYIRETLKQAGELGGKKYDEIREFATLAFTWPLERREGTPRPSPCSRTRSRTAPSGAISPVSRPRSAASSTAGRSPAR